MKILEKKTYDICEFMKLKDYTNLFNKSKKNVRKMLEKYKSLFMATHGAPNSHAYSFLVAWIISRNIDKERALARRK